MNERVLFLCTHNSARSQMAEGWLRSEAGDKLDAHSAGTVATRVHPLAIQAMAEVGIDISGYLSKTLAAYHDQPWDVAITVCDQARDACPIVPGARERLHWSFPDPSRVDGTEEERLTAFRTVRDAIRDRIVEFLRDRDYEPDRRINTEERQREHESKAEDDSLSS